MSTTKCCIACQDRGVLTYACLMDDAIIVPFLQANTKTWFAKQVLLYPHFSDEITQYEMIALWCLQRILLFQSAEERIEYCNRLDSVSHKAVEDLITSY